jgi:hypothetical protein
VERLMPNEAIISAMGLPGISKVPYGSHLCHFYRDKEDLADCLISFFRAGLDSNDSCIWITAEPLTEQDAVARLSAAYPGTQRAIESGQLAIFGANEWYLRTAGNSPQEILNLWLAAEEKATSDGFAGLRISGNTSFLDESSFQEFLVYERLCNEAFSKRRIIALCSYPRIQATPQSQGHHFVSACHHQTIRRDESVWMV